VGRSLGRFLEDISNTLSGRDASPSRGQVFEKEPVSQNLPKLPINSENLPTPPDHPADDDEWEEGLI
jgi:hypothetical protein